MDNNLDSKESDLMWNFIALNLHRLTDSKVQLNETSVNTHESNNIARSYQQDTRDTDSMEYRLLQSFELFPEGGNKCCTAYIIRNIIPNLGASKSKLWPNRFIDL